VTNKLFGAESLVQVPGVKVKMVDRC